MSPVDQLMVPFAIPEGPVELFQETSTTPTLSCAVPLTAINARFVETLVVDGFAIVNDGAVWLRPPWE